MKLRLFCALPIPAEVQGELSAAIEPLRDAVAPAKVSWVKPGNFHLTFSFLGDVEQTRVDELTRRLHIACQDARRFELRCARVGCFPNCNRPRVLWAGVQAQTPDLSRLQSRVAAAIAPFAQKKEKNRFDAHITLGRVRPGENFPQDSFARAIERYRETLFGEWQVEDVELLQSDLSQGAPRYAVLNRVLLP